jgi:tetratricopeptide (TPR) repeat protein
MKKLVTHTGLLVLAAALAAPAAAHAQEQPDAATQAKAHYEYGMTAYGLGHYDRAVQAFTRAYEVDPAPILLYNVAQAYWKKGDAEQAITYYQRYLEEEPTTRNRARIRARIRELQALQKTEPAPAPPPVEVVPTATEEKRPTVDLRPPRSTPPPSILSPALAATDLQAAAPPREPPIYRRRWFWPAMGAASLVTVAAAFLLRPDPRGWTCGMACLSTREIP